MCWTFSVVHTSMPAWSKFLHVLPPLGVPRAGCIGMRQFIYQDQLWLTSECGIEIELAERHAAIRHFATSAEL